MKLLKFFPAALIILFACSSGKQAFERGEYYSAVMQAVSRLKSNPDHKKSQEILRSSYPMAVEYLETDARNIQASNASNKWQSALQAYEKINNMYEAIRQSPGALRVIANPKNYYSEMGPLKEKAAEELYNAGIASLMKGTRQDAKHAYYQFSEAHRYVPNYKDVLEYLEKARTEATVFVAVEQVTVPARYNLSGNFFHDKVEEFLMRNYPEEGFVRFFNSNAARELNLPRVDQIMRLQFDDFSVGNTTTTERVETVSKDSVKVGEAKVNGQTVPVYNTVTAKVTTVRREVVSQGLLSMIITDNKSGAVLSHRKFPGRYVWTATWARFNGDERALSPQQLELCKKPEAQPPDPQNMFLAFAAPIYEQFTQAVQEFYRNY
ncbi:MAG: hypothetical protein KatS3mg032_0295 [Cyclobacteriaceae bacterium]|nr:MAG: hypothetical protein KatS3mg032_0295 [Cyclobacteriaceae bacterium]